VVSFYLLMFLVNKNIFRRKINKLFFFDKILHSLICTTKIKTLFNCKNQNLFLILPRKIYNPFFTVKRIIGLFTKKQNIK